MMRFCLMAATACTSEPLPQALLFTPWRLATGHDLPQNFGLFVFAFGGFLFACSSLLGLLDLAGVRPGSFVLALLLLALGVYQGCHVLAKPLRHVPRSRSPVVISALRRVCSFWRGEWHRVKPRAGWQLPA